MSLSKVMEALERSRQCSLVTDVRDCVNEAIAILREHMGEQGQPEHSHLSRAVPSEPSTTREAAEEEDLDAWECDACDGTGSYTVYRAVTHQLGTDELPFTEVCEVCGGGGYCGPDAARAELRRALP